MKRKRCWCCQYGRGWGSGWFWAGELVAQLDRQHIRRRRLPEQQQGKNESMDRLKEQEEKRKASPPHGMGYTGITGGQWGESLCPNSERDGELVVMSLRSQLVIPFLLFACILAMGSTILNVLDMYIAGNAPGSWSDTLISSWLCTLIVNIPVLYLGPFSIFHLGRRRTASLESTSSALLDLLPDR